MTHAEYSKLFHRAKLNLVAFKHVYHCDDELRKMVEMAVEAEREACAKMCEGRYMGDNNREDMEAKRCAAAIRARSDE